MLRPITTKRPSEFAPHCGCGSDRALVVRFDERLVENLRRAADVEGAHGELRSGLADRLRGDDADRFTDVDRRAAGQVASVALAATPNLASQVSTERMRIALTPAFSIVSTSRSSSISPPA